MSVWWLWVLRSLPNWNHVVSRCGYPTHLGSRTRNLKNLGWRVREWVNDKSEKRDGEFSHTQRQQDAVQWEWARATEKSFSENKIYKFFTFSTFSETFPIEITLIFMQKFRENSGTLDFRETTFVTTKWRKARRRFPGNPHESSWNCYSRKLEKIHCFLFHRKSIVSSTSFKKKPQNLHCEETLASNLQKGFFSLLCFFLSQRTRTKKFLAHN